MSRSARVTTANRATPLPEIRNRFSTTWVYAVELNVERVVALHRRRHTSRVRSPIDIESQDYFRPRRGLEPSPSSRRWRRGAKPARRPRDHTEGITARNNGNTYPGGYDSLGQYWFVAASFHM